ncbi:MAG: hypothetical protein ACD_79C00540G0003 [uncultured bacterium]|nr:MAG: hypothetical protein ACD_79C00540G0003 [uncultured bacterium]
MKLNKILLLFIIFTIFYFYHSKATVRKVVIVNKNSKAKKNTSVLQFPVSEIKTDDFETNNDFEPQGSVKAKKGGFISMCVSSFPPTYRTIGKDTHLSVLSMLEGLVYESLLSMDPETLKYVPFLATHWKISGDKLTYFFKINENARWSDGYPVTASDVLETFKLITDKGIEDPSISTMFLENFETPEIVTEYVIKVKCRKSNWRNFMYFSQMPVFPAHHCSKVDGRSFLKKYQYYMMPGTGPYRLNLTKTLKGKKLILDKVKAYWGMNLKQNQGLNNFDEIKFVVVADERLQLEKFKKHEFDVYVPARARWWNEELVSSKFEPLKRGLVRKLKVFNYKPLGTSGFAFNTLEPPFNDIRARKAFSMLWNVDNLIDKMFFNEYVRCNSYFQGTVFENEKNEKQKYDPVKALELLKEAGWSKTSTDKWLSKDGGIFEIDLTVESDLNNVFTPLQEDLEQAGIKLNIINMADHAIFERIMTRKFSIAYLGWTGMLIPNPETSMHSKYAQVPNTNNITGLRLPRIDEICNIYDKSYDVSERISLLREVDYLATGEYHYAFGWVAPYSARMIFWNKFGYPESGLNYSGDFSVISVLWWIDKEKETLINKANDNKNISIPQEPEIIDFWKRMK